MDANNDLVPDLYGLDETVRTFLLSTCSPLVATCYVEDVVDTNAWVIKCTAL